MATFWWLIIETVYLDLIGILAQALVPAAVNGRANPTCQPSLLIRLGCPRTSLRRWRGGIPDFWFPGSRENFVGPLRPSNPSSRYPEQYAHTLHLPARETSSEQYPRARARPGSATSPDVSRVFGEEAIDFRLGCRANRLGHGGQQIRILLADLVR